MQETFHCSLVTPEASILDEPVKYAELPAHDGQLGVLPHHAALLVELAPGKLRLVLADERQTVFFLDGGFAQVRDNRLTLLSERAVSAADVDAEQARADLLEASSLPSSTEAQFTTRQHRLASARARLELAGHAV